MKFNPQPVYAFHPDGTPFRKFDSQKECAEFANVSRQTILNLCGTHQHRLLLGSYYLRRTQEFTPAPGKKVRIQVVGYLNNEPLPPIECTLAKAIALTGLSTTSIYTALKTEGGKLMNRRWFISKIGETPA